MRDISSAHGVKIASQAKFNLSPSPQVIINYFKGQLRYYTRFEQQETKTEYFILFTKDLNPKDNPCFEVLRRYILRSSFLINLYNGSMPGNQLELITPDGKHEFFYGYDDVDKLEEIYGTEFKDAVTKVFTWHLYIRRCTLEFIDGGWMNRPNAKAKLEEVKDKYIYSSRYGFVNILEQTKQAAFERVYTPKKNNGE